MIYIISSHLLFKPTLICSTLLTGHLDIGFIVWLSIFMLFRYNLLIYHCFLQPFKVFSETRTFSIFHFKLL